jgi:hypothetical protein
MIVSKFFEPLLGVIDNPVPRIGLRRKDGYPFLAVALSPTEVSAVAYDTRQEAEAHNAARATEAARVKPGDQDA